MVVLKMKDRSGEGEKGRLGEGERALLSIHSPFLLVSLSVNL